MKLTPLDIRKQDFGHALRGYDPDDVQAFLHMLSEQWQEQLDARRRTEEKVRDLKAKLEHYERVEEALQEALRTARENKEQILENAQREAQVTIKEAEARAREIKGEAREERDRLKQEAKQLGNRRGEIVARLRAFLMSEMELLARFEGEDPARFVQFLPTEEQRYLGQQSDADLDAPADHSSGAPEEPLAHAAQAPNQQAPEQQAPAPEAQDDDELPDYLARFSGEEEFPEKEEPRLEAPMDREEDAPLPSENPAQPAGQSAQPAEQERDEPGWIVHSLFSAESSPDASGGDEEAPLPEPPHRAEGEGAAASSEEIEKIRRILNSMDE